MDGVLALDRLPPIVLLKRLGERPPRFGGEDRLEDRSAVAQEREPVLLLLVGIRLKLIVTDVVE